MDIYYYFNQKEELYTIFQTHDHILNKMDLIRLSLILDISMIIEHQYYYFNPFKSFYL